MSVSAESIHSFILDELSSITGRERATLSPDTPLIGSSSVVSSRELVELLLAVEEFSEAKLGVRFDWTSDSAMSEARSIYRNVGSLTEHLDSLQRTSA